MSVAVSNIAWAAEEDPQVEEVLRAAGVDRLEAAPARLLDDPLGADASEAADVAAGLLDRGLRLVALQSLFFGVEDLALFGTHEQRERFAACFVDIFRLAGAMAVPVLVYGAPGTRRVPEGMAPREALGIATGFFSGLAPVAEQHGTAICIEPNPIRYGANFVTTSDEGAELVAAVDAPGFGLHLDAAAMTLSGEPVERSIARHGDLLRHFHASAPDLGVLEDEVVDHRAAAAGLRAAGYAGTVSMEMRAAAPGTNADRVRDALQILTAHYDVQPIGAA